MVILPIPFGIPTVPLETLSMQDLAGCDYYRTPENFLGGKVGPLLPQSTVPLLPA